MLRQLFMLRQHFQYIMRVYICSYSHPMCVFCFVEKIQNGGTHTLNLVKYPDNLNQKGNYIHFL